MKKTFGILLLLLVTLASRASSTNQYFPVTLSLTIPDANPTGLASTLTVSGMSGLTADITVNFDITGGFNGDLYAYLLSPTGTMVVLLNRVGMNSGNAFGYGDAGFNITLDSASANNVHNYGGNGGLQLTGTWAPDSRAINPLSAPGAFDAPPNGNTLTSLDGTDPNGVWTLFVADLSGGGQSTIVSWGLTVMTVPEPQTWTLLGGGFATFWLLTRKHRNQKISRQQN